MYLVIIIQLIKLCNQSLFNWNITKLACMYIQSALILFNKSSSQGHSFGVAGERS